MVQTVAEQASETGASSAPHDAIDRMGRLRGLADRLDDISERCAAKATTARSDIMEENLLVRAAVYQECAGLIREALK